MLTHIFISSGTTRAPSLFVTKKKTKRFLFVNKIE